MAQQTRKWNPGDASNVFVRVILSDAGALLGGLSDEEWDKTLGWFHGRCAYTGEELAQGQMDQDHAVPMNRAHCGLHLYGNVVPATRDANRERPASTTVTSSRTRIGSNASRPSSAHRATGTRCRPEAPFPCNGREQRGERIDWR